ncbi:MAG: PEP-CTERM sorting domain-containing protein, partial [Hyphomicrobiales bacterium]
KMQIKSILCCGAAMMTLATAPAQAATINLIDNGFAGTAAQQEQFRNGFRIAAAYWGSILTNNATINLGVGTASLASGIIGSTGSTRVDYSTSNWVSRVNATRSTSSIDSNIVLPTLTNGGASFITNGVATTTTANQNPLLPSGVDDLTAVRYDNAATASSRTLYLNSSLIKAIGGTAAGVNSASVDGNVQFSTNFNFDFDPTNGISAGTFDFVGVAIHEIGHALGFVSGVDFLDVYGRGPGTSPNEDTLGYSLNDTSIYSALDMFRYSADPTGLVPGGAARDLSAGTVTGAKFFSIDGGATALFGNTFSTGRFNGDGQQASHWKDNLGLGILDPTFSFGEMGGVTGLDLAAFDAMGWNVSTNALTYGRVTTSAIYSQFAGAVPEPTTWAMMIGGFGLMGGMMRRRVAKVSYAA